MYYLGIDPGLSEVGFGIVKCENRETTFVDCGIFKTTPALPFGERLTMIKNDLKEILSAYKFEGAGIEELFFVKNITNGMKVAHSRGVVYEEISSQGINIVEFKPKEVKANICGSGAADKKQVQEMVKRLLNLQSTPKPHDAADALAIAILTSRMINL